MGPDFATNPFAVYGERAQLVEVNGCNRDEVFFAETPPPPLLKDLGDKNGEIQ